MTNNLKCRKSFTLVELLITMVVSALVINGVIMSIVNSMVLNQYNQEFSIAMNIARAEIEESIGQRTSFGSILTENTTLTLAANGLTGCARKVVSPIVSNELANVQVFVCWRGRGGRIIGNCTNAAGGCVSTGSPTSPCVLETAVARR